MRLTIRLVFVLIYSIFHPSNNQYDHHLKIKFKHFTFSITFNSFTLLLLFMRFIDCIIMIIISNVTIIIIDHDGCYVG